MDGQLDRCELMVLESTGTLFCPKKHDGGTKDTYNCFSWSFHAFLCDPVGHYRNAQNHHTFNFNVNWDIHLHKCVLKRKQGG